MEMLRRDVCSRVGFTCALSSRRIDEVDKGAQPKPGAECIPRVFRCRRPAGYRLNEATAVLNAAGVLALTYIVSASTPAPELAAEARKRKLVFLRDLASARGIE
jgi:hypothetical protein